MLQFAQFVIAGLATGGIYAIASAGLVVTYTSSGILNFSFGAIAFFVARFYYFLHTQQNWGILPAAVLSIVVAAPPSACCSTASSSGISGCRRL